MTNHQDAFDRLSARVSHPARCRCDACWVSHGDHPAGCRCDECWPSQDTSTPIVVPPRWLSSRSPLPPQQAQVPPNAPASARHPRPVQARDHMPIVKLPSYPQYSPYRGHVTTHESFDFHIRRMVASIMPYEPHPITGFHSRIPAYTTHSREVLKITGGWPMPGTAPLDFQLKWPRPKIPDIPIELAPWLVPNPLDAKRPTLDWDMSQRASTAQKATIHHSRSQSIPKNALDLPATNPPCSHMSIVCSFGVLGTRWGPLSITRRMVTVWDVLDQLFEFLYTPLTPSEVHEMDQLQHALNLPPQIRMTSAASARSKRSSEISARPKAQYRRVDCLGERRCFWGLWISYTADGTWYLNLGTQPKYEPRSVHFY